MSERYSYSKIGAYISCPLSYDLQHVRKIKIPKEYSYDVAKGLIFHKYAEVYRGNSEEAMAIALNQPEVKPEHLSLITAEQHESIKKACKVFDWFYETALKEKEKFISREFNITDKTPSGRTFTGFIDLLILDPSNCWIIDYKTGKSADASTYANQLYTYLHYISKKYSLPIEKMKAAVFFPFADVEKNEDRLKKIRVTPKKINEQIEKLDTYITEIESPQRSVEPKLQWLCSYCAYRGIQELCPTSVIAGAKPVRHFDESTKTIS